MLIRSTPQACFVILKNGLTLELFYNETLTGNADRQAQLADGAEQPSASPTASQGVWLIGESVLFEVSAGQA